MQFVVENKKASNDVKTSEKYHLPEEHNCQLHDLNTSKTPPFFVEMDPSLGHLLLQLRSGLPLFVQRYAFIILQR
jgi:hypothetical protein